MTTFAYAMLFRSDDADLRDKLDMLAVSDEVNGEIVALTEGTAREFDLVRGVFGWAAAERVLGGSVTKAPIT